MNKPSHDFCKECKDWNGCITDCMNICGIPIDIVEEWKKYRAIGTVEECLRNKDLLDFLSDEMNPNDFERYLRIYNSQDEKGSDEE